MPPKALLDPSSLDVERVLHDAEAIRRVNPQRFEMQMLDGILRYDPEENLCVGFKDVREDEFWVRGHLPGRPIFPGVLLVEAAAQLCTFFWAMREGPPPGSFYGFGGVDGARFRGVVAPPCRLVLAVALEAKRSRLVTWATQAFVGSRLVYEGTILGVVV